MTTKKEQIHFSIERDQLDALTALSPLAGTYYWARGEREEEVAVKIVSSDDETTADVTVDGDVEEVERLAKALGLMEKGKVYVKGLLG